VCWGQDTNVEEDNIRDFSGNWTGTGVISGSGDAEMIELYPGDDMESETWFIGSGSVMIVEDKYGGGPGAATIQYKTGATKEACEADSWHNYVGAFNSLNWVKIRVSA
jgi:hypothetical protein